MSYNNSHYDGSYDKPEITQDDRNSWYESNHGDSDDDDDDDDDDVPVSNNNGVRFEQPWLQDEDVF